MTQTIRDRQTIRARQSMTTVDDTNYPGPTVDDTNYPGAPVDVDDPGTQTTIRERQSMTQTIRGDSR